MNILITGAHGQLGSELQGALASGRTALGPVPDAFAGAEVMALSRAELDVSNMRALDLLMLDNRFDVIFNCAGMTNVDACEDDMAAAREANAVGPQLLAFAAQRAGSKLVHISTDYVFDGNASEPYVEDDLPNPQTVYGRSKLEGELFVSNFCERHFIVRTSWLYGAGGGNFVKTILRLADERDTLKVVDDQRGNPTYAGDLVHELLRMAATENYGTYHCTGEGVCSWYDFACAIVREAGASCRVEPCTTDEFPRPAKRPAYSALRNKHLEDSIGNEMRPWREALQAFLS